MDGNDYGWIIAHNATLTRRDTLLPDIPSLGSFDGGVYWGIFFLFASFDLVFGALS